MSIHYDADYDFEYMNLKFNKSNVSNVTKKQSRAGKRLRKMVHENSNSTSNVEKNTRETKEHSKRGSGKAYIRNYRKFNH